MTWHCVGMMGYAILSCQMDCQWVKEASSTLPERNQSSYHRRVMGIQQRKTEILQDIEITECRGASSLSTTRNIQMFKLESHIKANDNHNQINDT